MEKEKAEDLIFRKAAIDALIEHRALYCDNTPDTFSKLSYAEKSRVDELDTAIATLVNMPSADVREVIRCKDCKYASSYWIEGTIFCVDSECPNLEDGFCNRAERRGDA